MSVIYVPERRILPHLFFFFFSGGSCDNSNCKLYGLNRTKTGNEVKLDSWNATENSEYLTALEIKAAN